jgi:hypothetical protein
MASRPDTGDPRLRLPQPEDGDIRPLVPTGQRNIPTWALIAAVVIAGLILFAVLDAQRRDTREVAEQPAGGFVLPPPPPPLAIPPAPSSRRPRPPTRPSPSAPRQNRHYHRHHHQCLMCRSPSGRR